MKFTEKEYCPLWYDVWYACANVVEKLVASRLKIKTSLSEQSLHMYQDKRCNIPKDCALKNHYLAEPHRSTNVLTSKLTCWRVSIETESFIFFFFFSVLCRLNTWMIWQWTASLATVMDWVKIFLSMVPQTQVRHAKVKNTTFLRVLWTCLFVNMELHYLPPVLTSFMLILIT